MTPAEQKAFFEEDWVLSADNVPLNGRVLTMRPSRRVKRDEISGEPLPVAPDSGEPVIVAELSWELPGRPATLTLHRARMARDSCA